MKIIGLDKSGCLCKIQGAVGFKIQGLGLDTAQHGSPPDFVTIGMGRLPCNIFIAALTMTQQSQQVALGSAGHKKSRILSC